MFVCLFLQPCICLFLSGFRNVYDGNANSTTLTDLVGSTKYAISVAGLTTEEQLDLIGPVEVETCEYKYTIQYKALKILVTKFDFSLNFKSFDVHSVSQLIHLHQGAFIYKSI